MSALLPPLATGFIAGLLVLIFFRKAAFQRVLFVTLGIGVVAYVIWLLAQTVFGLSGYNTETNIVGFVLGILAITGLRDALNVIIERARRN